MKGMGCLYRGLPSTSRVGRGARAGRLRLSECRDRLPLGVVRRFGDLATPLLPLPRLPVRVSTPQDAPLKTEEHLVVGEELVSGVLHDLQETTAIAIPHVL